MIKVLIFGVTLKQIAEASEYEFAVEGSTTIRALLEGRQELTVFLPYMNKGELLVTVNRKVGTLDTKVQDGDVVKLTHQFNPTYEGATWHNP